MNGKRSIWFVLYLYICASQTMHAAHKSSSLWEGFSDQMKATLPLVLATSTSNVVVQAVLPPITQLLNTIVATCSFMVRIGQKGFNRMCNRPNPLQVSELYIWEQIVENMTGTLCEQSIAGTIMLKNVPRIDADAREGRDHWDYYVSFIAQVFGHIAQYLESKIPYYLSTPKQRIILVTVANSLSLEDRAGIVFMLNTIISNMRHLVQVCKSAPTFEDLDVEHVKKVSRNTLLLFKKLREMIASSYDQKNGIVAQPVAPNAGIPLVKNVGF